MMSMMTLVVGGTGTVGGLVIPEVLARSGAVRALVRRESRAGDLPEGVEPVVADLADVDAIGKALRGVDAAFYVHPHMDDDVAVGTGFIQACEDAGVRLVFGGFHVVDPEARRAFGDRVPSYRGKLEIGERVAASKTNPVILDLANFAQNDEVFREDILAGVFPTPLSEAGVNRLDLRDAGEIAARALLEPAFPTGWYGLQGVDALNGPECAQVWSEELGRPVRYIGDETDEWRDVFARRLSGRKLTDWLASSEMILRSTPLPTVPERLEETTQLLGRPPRRYREYVRDTAKRWLVR